MTHEACCVIAQEIKKSMTWMSLEVSRLSCKRKTLTPGDLALFCSFPNQRKCHWKQNLSIQFLHLFLFFLALILHGSVSILRFVCLFDSFIWYSLCVFYFPRNFCSDYRANKIFQVKYKHSSYLLLDRKSVV